MQRRWGQNPFTDVQVTSDWKQLVKYIWSWKKEKTSCYWSQRVNAWKENKVQLTVGNSKSFWFAWCMTYWIWLLFAGQANWHGGVSVVMAATIVCMERTDAENVIRQLTEKKHTVYNKGIIILFTFKHREWGAWKLSSVVKLNSICSVKTSEIAYSQTLSLKMGQKFGFLPL